MTDSAAPLKVLSVTGAGRSGTTVLASILDGIDGWSSAGELRQLWKRGVAEGRPCACGLVPERCPVWAPVVARTLLRSDGMPRDDALRRIVTAQQALSPWRRRARVLRSAGGGDGAWTDLEQVRSTMAAGLAAFAHITGARVVVDTSKRAEDAAVLAAINGVEHYVLHIVRDPRAVVHSWRRSKSFYAGGSQRTMGTRRLPSTVRRWIENCLSTELLLRQLPPDRWLRIRYEDFSENPRAVVGDIIFLLGESGEAPFEDDHTVRLGANHIVAGNPSRFTTGSVQIKADDEWASRMPRRDQLFVEWATKPLMYRYGYAGRRTSDTTHRT